ncbi:hypothetical protein [Agrobacterium rosae]|uniref:hypothetical protein n=1 Tax=Agrobacterium rosae TaxID=1972867 RepID=UPI00203392E1|nr:hypothetical protein [Agrobacterium rosae]MCM2432101.1 hypothetical protein [Agrobacterium rosae]
METEIKYDKDNAESYLGAAIVAYSQALEIALKSLAETRGVDNLEWFDELRSAMIRTAKGTSIEQIAVEVDAGAVRFGFEALDASLNAIRLRLIEE